MYNLSLVDGRGNLRGERYRSHVVRRLKLHIPNRFKTRIVEPKPVMANNKEHPDYVALQQGLLEFLAPELRKAFRKRRYSDVLAFLALLKRSVSTVEACKTTLTVVAERFQQLLTEGSETQESRRQRLKTLREYLSWNAAESWRWKKHVNSNGYNSAVKKLRVQMCKHLCKLVYLKRQILIRQMYHKQPGCKSPNLEKD